MAMQASKVDVWAATIEDRPGGLHEKLAPLTEAGADFAFVIARRAHGKPGQGTVFLTPVSGTKQINAAKKAGFEKTEHVHTLRVEADDRPGLGAELTRTLADNGISLHGLSAAVADGRCVIYLGLDSADDANKAARLVRKL